MLRSEGVCTSWEEAWDESGRNSLAVAEYFAARDARMEMAMRGAFAGSGEDYKRRFASLSAMARKSSPYEIDHVKAEIQAGREGRDKLRGVFGG